MTVTLIGLLAGTASAAVKVTPLRISESRSKVINKVEGEKSFTSSDNGSLTIQLLVAGPEVTGATHFGKVDVKKATDDAGNSAVSDSRSRFSRDRFSELNRKHMWFFHDNPPKDKVKIDIRLKVTPRGAKRLAVLEGSLVLRSTDYTQVTAAPSAGKAIADKALGDAGITVDVKRVDAKNGMVEMSVSDPNDKLGDIELVDASGKAINSGRSSFGFNKKKTVRLDSDKPLPSGVKVRIPIAVKVTNVDVPFKLENIELP